MKPHTPDTRALFPLYSQSVWTSVSLLHFPEWDLDGFLFLHSSIRYFRNLTGFLPL